jgi:hypothetical protein
MADEALNLRGPCSSCGAPLASDQRYCVECGHRVGPPLALPYAVPAEPAGALPAERGPAGRWFASLPMPLQTASSFAALALGFGVVIGTAISPNLAGIVAAPAPTVVAQTPPPSAPAPPTGGGGGGGGAVAPASGAVAAATAVSPPTTGSGGGGGGGGKKKKGGNAPATKTYSGTVVRVNPVAGSYTIATGGLLAIHADTLPQVGDQVSAPVRNLANGTYAESGARSQTGTANTATFSGTVTYCTDLEQPSAPCDGSSPTDHYAYVVSGVGASVLVSAPHPAQGAPPKVGSSLDVTVHIGDPFQAIDPTTPWPTNPSCTPPYDEQHGQPAQPPKTPELTQTSVSVASQSSNAALEAVVQTVCPGSPQQLILSADDIRESGRDLAGLAIPNGIDPTKLSPGEAVQVAVDVANDGSLALRGITSDQGTAGADDASQGQGTLVGS